MSKDLREDAKAIAMSAIESCLPEKAVKKALKDITTPPSVTCLSIGKAAWRMAKAAKDTLGTSIVNGLVITKDGHSQGDIPSMKIMETSHPVPDRRSVDATEEALAIVKSMTEKDHLLVLLSGGGSSLFEKPLPEITLEDITKLTEQLLKSGAAIDEINTIRKRLSSVKAGRLAQLAYPAKVTTLILSDVLGDRLDAVASGPTMEDKTTSDEAIAIVKRYNLSISDSIKSALLEKTPGKLTNSVVLEIGSVKQLCLRAKAEAEKTGYYTQILTTSLDCEASEAGCFMGAIAREGIKRNKESGEKQAFIVGGETVVHLRGQGLGGRNQELALTAAIAMQGLKGCVLISIGSDGTDGPTDAAGGLVDGKSTYRMTSVNIDPLDALQQNDSYHALESSGDLLRTGPTGTNVNDLIILLIG